jgi:hypothetical protein
LGASLEGRRPNLRRVVLRDNHYSGLGLLLNDQPGRFQAVEPGHTYIENHDIGLERFALLDGVDAIHRFAANLPLGRRLQQGAQAAPKNLMIIYNQNTRVLHFV